MSFTSELPSAEEQRKADQKAVAQANAVLAAAARLAAEADALKAKGEAAAHISKPQTIAADDTASGLSPTDPCAPGLSRKARMQRLSIYGPVRETGSNTFTSGGHSLAFFYDGSLLSCS
jgi:hypothetical protein